MIELPLLTPHDIAFPDVELALEEPNGLLAFGGDLSCARLRNAYRLGIFPWYSQGEPILWWSPDPRAIITYERFHISKSLRKWLSKHSYRVTVNNAFDEVIKACSSIPRSPIKHEDGTESTNGVWINANMVSAYKALHREGAAHSIEVWEGNQLVGGLYGVCIGNVFCGESMFHKRTNASKLAFVSLVQFCQTQGIHFIDCQLENPYLQSFGCFAVTREEFRQRLQHAYTTPYSDDIWQPRELAPVSLVYWNVS